ncbi:hypothetical protein Ancab_032056 [Ancistrocladus abbreviatus]
MGMILHTSPCVPMSMALGTMAGLDMLNTVAPGIYSFNPLEWPKEMVQDENSANDIFETNEEFDVGGFLSDQAPYPINEPIKNELLSNDNMIQNLKRLDVENSSSEGQSITSVEPKRHKASNVDKPVSKKKKTQAKSSYSEFL